MCLFPFRTLTSIPFLFFLRLSPPFTLFLETPSVIFPQLQPSFTLGQLLDNLEVFLHDIRNCAGGEDSMFERRKRMSASALSSPPTSFLLRSSLYCQDLVTNMTTSLSLSCRVGLHLAPFHPLLFPASLPSSGQHRGPPTSSFGRTLLPDNRRRPEASGRPRSVMIHDIQTKPSLRI
jgi:hypothetical protein